MDLTIDGDDKIHILDVQAGQDGSSADQNEVTSARPRQLDFLV